MRAPAERANPFWEPSPFKAKPYKISLSSGRHGIKKRTKHAKKKLWVVGKFFDIRNAKIAGSFRGLIKIVNVRPPQEGRGYEPLLTMYSK